jgi:hypothetical protein
MKMAYAVTNFKTKKLFKAAVAAKEAVRAYQPGLGSDLSNYTGSVCLEGPHYPAAHTWYAACEMKDGVVIKVK